MVFRAALLATAQALAALGLAGGPEPPVASVGEVLWRGSLEGLETAAGPRAFDLSPDGRNLLYLHGAPWPRVVVQPLPSRPGERLGEPVVLGGAPPFGFRPPRFDLRGRYLFFTADFSSPPGARAARTAPVVSPPGRAERPAEPLRPAVARARVDGSGMERLLPAVGAKPSEYAVFLDVHPGGRLILIGAGEGLDDRQAASGGYSLELGELALDESGTPLVPVRPLSFQVKGQALARYSWDGTAIYYSQGPARSEGSPVFRYRRADAIHEPAGLDDRAIGWLAGDVEVAARPLPHPGSTGWDGFPARLLSRGPESPAVPLLLSEPLLTPLPLAPVSVRGNCILLAGGPEDRPLLALGVWDPAAFESALAASARSPHPLAGDRAALRPGFSAEEVRASARDERARGLLRRIHGSLVLLPGAPLLGARARWKEKTSGSDPKGESEVEATEWLSGEMQIEHTVHSLKPDTPPLRRTLAYDGKEAWSTGERGESAALDRESFLAEASRASPLGLLIDPLGLGSPGLTFSFLGEEGEKGARGERRLIKLRLESLDGYRAEVWAAPGVAGGSGGGEGLEGQLLPARIESPLLRKEERSRKGMVAAAGRRRITFGDYHPAGGRLLPERITIEDARGSLELTLLQVELNPPAAKKFGGK